METTSENTFYQDANVLVTQSRFVANGKTFAMRNISSVSLHKIDHSIFWPLLFMMIGAVVCIVSLIVGAFILAPSFVWILAIPIEYSVKISSNSGDVDGIVSSNKEYIQKIVDAINEAIIYRG